MVTEQRFDFRWFRVELLDQIGEVVPVPGQYRLQVVELLREDRVDHARRDRLLARLRGPSPGTMLLWAVALVAIVAGGYASALLVRGIEAGKLTRVGITSADALLSLAFAASTMLGNIVWRTREHNRQREQEETQQRAREKLQVATACHRHLRRLPAGV